MQRSLVSVQSDLGSLGEEGSLMLKKIENMFSEGQSQA